MNPRFEDISSILKEQIKNYNTHIEMKETGTVVTVGDGIARAHGLGRVMAGELVEFSGGVSGIALNLEEESVGIAIFGQLAEATTRLSEGDRVELLRPLQLDPKEARRRRAEARKRRG